MLSLWLSIIAIVVSFASAIAGFLRWLVTFKQIKVQNLLQVSQYLHQTEYRNARHTVRTTPKDQLDLNCVRSVCSSFDFAALFIRNNLIDETMFLEYWAPMLVFLRSHLSDVIDTYAFGTVTLRRYYQHFDWLMDEAEKHPLPPLSTAQHHAH